MPKSAKQMIVDMEYMEQLAAHGTASAYELSQAAVDLGYLLVGRAVESLAHHEPQEALNWTNGAWEPMVRREGDDSALWVVRASKVPSTAIMCAVLADCGQVGQREGSGQRIYGEFTSSDDKIYGWEPDTQRIDGYRMEVAAPLLEGVRKRAATKPGENVGVIDILADDGSWKEFANEPGHYYSENSHATRGTIVVPARALLDLLDRQPV